MNLPQILYSPLVQRLGWSLIHSLWELAALAVLLGVLLLILRRRSPQARYLACCAAMALMLGAPVATLWAIRPAPAIVPSPAPAAIDPPPLPLPAPPAMAPIRPAPASLLPRPPVPAEPEPWRQRLRRLCEPFLPYLVGLWLAGVLLIGLWHTGGWVAAQRLKVLYTEPPDEGALVLLARLRLRIHLHRPVRLLLSRLVPTPLTLGWLRPAILLPIAVLNNLTPGQLEAILAHELAHIRRHDYLLNLLQTLVETLLFYHPAAWWIGRRMRAERELCCDDLAAEICGDRRQYAQALATVEELRMALPSTALAARGPDGREFVGRIRRLLGVEEEALRRRHRGAGALASIVAMLVMMVGLHVAGQSNQSVTTATSRATSPSVDAAALVREVRQAQRWVDEAKSFRVKLEVRRMPTDGADRPKATTRPEWQIAGEEQLQAAWDGKRVFYRVQADKGFRLDNHRVWDGQRALTHELYESGQEHYAIRGEPTEMIGRFVLPEIGWPRNGPHDFWWLPEYERNNDFYGDPDDFSIVGRKEFRGVACFVLEKVEYYQTWYVGVADHRLYGYENRVLPREKIRELHQVQLQLAKEFGKELANVQQYGPWLRTLPRERRNAVERQYFVRLRPISVPQFTNWLTDYREVVPNCWMPMTVGHHGWEIAADGIASPGGQRELKVVEVTVNEPLPDSLFTMRFKEGVTVFDCTRGVTLEYKHKENRSPEEWQAILEEANKRQEDDQQRTAAMDALKGQTAPPFPDKAQWLQSDPLTWETLKGKVVVLEFMAEWCGPCRNDLPTLASLHENRDPKQIVYIGVHTPGSEPEALAKFVAEQKLTLPICVDVPAEGGQQPWGKLYDGYHIYGIPHSFVVDWNGRIAGHGTLADAARIANQLLADAPATSQPATAPPAATQPAANSRPIAARDRILVKVWDLVAPGIVTEAERVVPDDGTIELPPGDRIKVKVLGLTEDEVELAVVKAYRDAKLIENANVECVRLAGPTSAPAFTPAVTQPAPVTRPVQAMHFVQIVVGQNAMTYEGQPITWDQLPALLERTPDRPDTVLCLAIDPGRMQNLLVREERQLQQRVSELAQRFGFAYSSYVGEHPLGEKGEASSRPRASTSPITAPASQPDSPDIEQARKLWASAIDAEAAHDFNVAVGFYETIKKLPAEAWPAGLQLRLDSAKHQVESVPPAEYYLSGVPRTGTYSLQRARPISIKQALIAGGATQADFDGKSILLIRRRPDGAVTRKLLAGKDVLSGGSDGPIEPGDVLMLADPQTVAELSPPDPNTYRILGDVPRPGTYHIVGEQRISLLQALIAAGANPPDARQRTLLLRRPDGKAATIRIADLLQDPSKDVELRPGDVVTVGTTAGVLPSEAQP